MTEEILRLDHGRPETATNIHAIMMAAYRIEAGWLDVTDFAPLARSEGKIVTAESAFFGAFVGSRLCAVAEIETGTGRRANIASLVVLPEYFRQGLGSALVRHLTGEHGAGGITVSTGTRNRAALGLYVALGFRESRRWVTPDGIPMITLLYEPGEARSTGGEVRLREMAENDLPVFFEHQRDPAAVHMAAFSAEDPEDRDAFQAHWAKILGDESITKRTVLLDGEVAGHVVAFERAGSPEVTYWIGSEHWGRGVATEALAQFLEEVRARPLHARVAADNRASIRVLQKCGFKITGRDADFANARGRKIGEILLSLGPK